MSASCPKCRQVLEDVQVDTINARVCRACAGMLLAHPELVQIVESSWRAVPEKVAEETPLHAPDGWQNEPMFHCPDCSAAMEKYGYMGIAAIQIDRCDGCNLVWLDANELQNMMLACAKSYRRSDAATKQALDDAIGPVLTSVALPAGRQSNWLFGRHADYGDDGVVLAETLLRMVLR